MGEIQGIDYYRGDGSPSFKGDDFAFIKCTEGTGYRDPNYTRERARIYSQGLVFGCYHFFHPGAISEQVDFFLSIAQPAPGDVLFLDLEEENGNWSGISAADLYTMAVQWVNLAREKAPENQVGIYCNYSDWARIIYPHRGGKIGDFLMIAEYSSHTPPENVPWLIWQHGTGGVDYDTARFVSRAEMRAWAYSKGQDLTPDESKMLQAVYEAVGTTCPPGTLQALAWQWTYVSDGEHHPEDLPGTHANRLQRILTATETMAAQEQRVIDPQKLAQALAPLLTQVPVETIAAAVSAAVGPAFAAAFARAFPPTPAPSPAV